MQWWVCTLSEGEVLIRIWYEYSKRSPDKPNSRGYTPYPFNGKGGKVVAGPFPSKDEAMAFWKK
jgi:hypothetical protein